MSEGNLPFRSNKDDSRESFARDGQLPLDDPRIPKGDDDWEAVPLFGMPPLGQGSAGSSKPNGPAVNEREADLQARIVDLSQCNEILLARVQQLEETLERSQQSRPQGTKHPQSEQEKLAAAQTRSVAQLLTELEQASAALERKTILAETLDAQLKNTQERVQQLEEECAALHKAKAERTHQLQAAEDACADLRSRLQRQQRYTLQFKAALEKCLDASAFQHASDCIENEVTPEVISAPVPTAESKPFAMPKSQSIKPWSANANNVQADPQLLSLMRSPAPAPEPTHPSAPLEVDNALTQPFPTDLPTPPKTSKATGPEQNSHDQEAEQQLWQDVERVINKTASAPSEPSEDSDRVSPTEAATAIPAIHQSDFQTTEFTEPIPWGAPVKSTPPESSVPETTPAANQASVENQTTTIQSEPLQKEHPRNISEANRAPSSGGISERPTIPALDKINTSGKSPSPLVHPLRTPQRKRKSLSAVELPSFPPLPKVEND